MSETERLDKIISSQSADGRKAAQRLIKNGAVLVNGKLCTAPDAKINPETDAITLNGRRVEFSKHIYIMMNKPSGVVSATRDKRFKTVIDLVPTEMRRRGLFPVGRLDRDTEGLLLITDDGEFAHSITSPKKHIEKKYAAQLDGAITKEIIKAFEKGIVFADGTRCRPAKLVADEDHDNAAEVTICEGKYHQVKKMFLSCGLKVVHLQRISIGDLYLDSNLPIGACKLLTNLDKRLIFIGNIH